MLNSLCVDFGSTFIKFFVYDGERIVFSDRLKFPEPCMNDGIVYQVPVQDIGAVLFQIFEKTKNYIIAKCFIAVQMHGYITKDKEGRFSNYVSWKDKSGDVTNELLRGIDFERNGTSLKNNLPAVKLLVGAHDNESEFFTLGSYIAYLLAGHNVTHKTDGCASGCFDAESLEPISQLRNIRLPRITSKVCPIGQYNGVEIYTPVGDHQLSFLGSDAGEEAYLLNIGTATQISTLSDRYEKHTQFEKRPYFSKHRLLTVSGLTGGEALFGGYDADRFCEEIRMAIKKLPSKNRVILGGGGADIVFGKLQQYLREYNIECKKLEKNISEEGLIKMVKMCETKVGTMLSEVCFPNFPVILKNEKVEFLIIDNEHGAFDYAFLSAVIMNARLVDLPVIIRLPDNSRRDITKLVDMGASGFLLPMTNNAKDIKKVVDYAKYAPIGKRGISTNRAHTLYNPPPLEAYMTDANKRVKVYAQIETKEGVSNIDEILTVNGVDGVFVGPNDLSCDMDCIGNNAPIKDALKTISEAAERHQKGWGIITTSKDLIDCSLENGASFISYGSEINMLKNASKMIRKNVFG